MVNFKKKSISTNYTYSKFESFKNYFKSSTPSPSGMIILFGSRGVGKSTDIAKREHKLEMLRKKGKCPYDKFYSNLKFERADPDFCYYLDLNKYRFTDYIDPSISSYKISTYGVVEKLKDGTIVNDHKPPFTIGKNCYICLDELGVLYQNRDYKNFPKEFTSYIKFLRHFGVYFVCYSQAYDIDKSLRTGANELYLLRRLSHITFGRKLKKYIAVADKDEENNADSQICDRIEFCSIFEAGSLTFTYIPFYTDKFNSYE